MKTRIITLAVLGLVALGLGACANARDTRMAEGAGIGGVGGALVCGVVGATAGALVADATRPRRGERYCYYSNTAGHRVCRYR